MKGKEYYRRLIVDIMELPEDSDFIISPPSEDKKQGIDKGIESINFTEEEKKVIGYRYDLKFENDEIADTLGITTNKVAMDIKSIINKIRYSCYFTYFVHGYDAGEIEEYEAKKLAREQINPIVIGYDYTDHTYALKRLDTRFLGYFEIQDDIIIKMYKNGLPFIGNICESFTSDLRKEEKLKGLTKAEIDVLCSKLKELKLI